MVLHLRPQRLADTENAAFQRGYGTVVAARDIFIAFFVYADGDDHVLRVGGQGFQGPHQVSHELRCVVCLLRGLLRTFNVIQVAVVHEIVFLVRTPAQIIADDIV